MAETYNKKEREKKKQQNKKAKAERKQERKDNPKNSSLDSMIAYVDENGNISSVPPDPKKRIDIKLEDIEIGTPKYVETDPEELIRKGVVTHFNNAKGYGFIKDIETQESVFVHINALTESIKEQDKVSFEIQMGPKGASAVNVVLQKK